MGELVNALQRLLAGTTEVSDLLAVLALLGVATAALIQAIKELVAVRRWFHEARLRRWVDRCRKELCENYQLCVPAQDVLDQLYDLAVDGDRCALLDLPSEEMAEHMTAAMRAAVESPSHYRELFLVGAHNAALEDINMLGTEPADDRGRVQIAEARSRVWYHMQRAVVGFEMAVRYRWKLWLQSASFLISAVITVFAVAPVTSLNASDLATGALRVGFAAMLAGFLAPVARDLTVAVKRLREGSA